MKKSIHRPEHKLLCARLRAVREAAGLTQAQLGKKLRLTQGWVSSVEVGTTRLDLVQLWEWCRACKTSVGELAMAAEREFRALRRGKTSMVAV